MRKRELDFVSWPRSVPGFASTDAWGPRFRWNWRRQCAALERVIQAAREQAEGILVSTCGLDINELPPDEFDEVMQYVGRAYDWLARCERLDETLYQLQATFRAEERLKQQAKKRKAAAI